MSLFCVCALSPMSRFLSLSSQRSSCGALTRCVSCLDSLCFDDGVDGMNEVGLALSILRAFSVGCSSVDPLDSLASLFSWSECDEQDKHVEEDETIRARSLGIASCLIRWGKHLPPVEIRSAHTNQTRTHVIECSPIEQSLGITPTQSIEQLVEASDLGDSFALGILSASL